MLPEKTGMRVELLMLVPFFAIWDFSLKAFTVGAVGALSISGQLFMLGLLCFSALLKSCDDFAI